MKDRKMKEKKIQIIHYLKFERIFVRPEKKKKNKNHCDLYAQLKKKQSEGGGEIGVALFFLVATP